MADPAKLAPPSKLARLGEARSLLGMDVSSLLPPLSAPLLRLPGTGGADSDGSPAFFDVLYLDSELLCIRQNEPGGVFAAVRVDDEEA